MLPDIGRLAPESARAGHPRGVPRARHRRRPAVHRPPAAAVGAAVTPDAVLEGVTVLARATAGAEAPGVVVLDVGGATTDVYCVPDPDAEQATLGREAVGVPARRRTVEGDLGVSWSVDALRAAAAGRGPARARRRPARAGGGGRDRRPAPAPARRGRPTEPGGASARAAGLVVLSGGVFRHADPAAVDAVVARLAADARGSRQRRLGHAPSSSTGATSSPPPGCSPPSIPRRPPGWCGAAGRRRHVSGRVITVNSRAERIGDRGHPAVDELLGAAGAGAAGLERPPHDLVGARDLERRGPGRGCAGQRP